MLDGRLQLVELSKLGVHSDRGLAQVGEQRRRLVLHDCSVGARRIGGRGGGVRCEASQMSCVVVVGERMRQHRLGSARE